VSNAYGAGSPGAGLNAPGGMPSWLMSMLNYVNPMAQATAGGVDAQGRPQDALTAAQQALAAQALAGGPQAQGPISGTQAGNVSTAPLVYGAPTQPVQTSPLLGNSLTARSVTPAMMAFMRGGGGGGGGGGASGAYPMDPGIAANMHPAGAPPPSIANVAAYTGVGQGPFAGRPPEAPSGGLGQGPFAGRPPIGTPSATPRPAPARDITVNKAAPVVPQVPWIDSKFERANLPAGNGPLGRNAQRQMGVIDFSKLFNRSS
jgi:hypothetical protein